MPSALLTPAAAGEIAFQARRMRRDGQLTPHDYTVLDALLWSLRAQGRDEVTASYSLIAEVAGVARSTVALAIKRLVALGLIQPIKRRALVIWEHGGRVWRQLPNLYRLLHRESARRPDSKTQDIIVSAAEPEPVGLRAARERLAAVRAQMEARLALR